jgi:hypothetical protein
MNNSPSPFILSPRRGNILSPSLILWINIRANPVAGILRRRETILLLLGEKAGMREI